MSNFNTKYKKEKMFEKTIDKKIKDDIIRANVRQGGNS